MICERCKSPISESETFCGECGYPVRTPSSVGTQTHMAPQRRSYRAVIAVILSIVLVLLLGVAIIGWVLWRRASDISKLVTPTATPDRTAVLSNKNVAMPSPVNTAANIEVAGTWNSDYGVITLAQDGSAISGTVKYPWGGTGQVVGSVDSKKLTFRFKDNYGDTGGGELTPSTDGRTLTGDFALKSGERGTLVLKRSSGKTPAVSTGGSPCEAGQNALNTLSRSSRPQAFQQIVSLCKNMRALGCSDIPLICSTD